MDERFGDSTLPSMRAEFEGRRDKMTMPPKGLFDDVQNENYMSCAILCRQNQRHTLKDAYLQDCFKITEKSFEFMF